MNDWQEAERRVEKAHDLYESGRWEEALHELRAAINVNPYQGEWHFNMGLTLEAMGRHKEAIDSFKHALKQHGDDADIFINLGINYLRLQDAQSALKVFTRSHEMMPRDDAPLAHLISAYTQLGKHELAETMFYMACQIDDNNPRTYFNIAISLLDRGLSDRAIWCLNRVRRLDPADPEAHARLAEAYWMKGKLDKAYRLYLKQMRIDPADTHSLMEMGSLLMEMGKPRDAVEKFRRVTELNPAHAEAHHYLGDLAFDANDFDTAQMTYQLVLRLNPATPQVHEKLAMIALRRHRLEDARKNLRSEMALERPVWTDREQRDLARLLMDAKLPIEAASVLRAQALLHPDNAHLHHELALAKFMNGRLREGVRHARRAVKLDRYYALAMHNLALAHLQLSEANRANYWIKRAVKINADDPRLRELETRLMILRIKQFFGKMIGR